MSCCGLHLPALLMALAVSMGGCTLHHVRDEVPVGSSLGGEPATVAVEVAPAGLDGEGEHVLVKVEHPRFVDIDGSQGLRAALVLNSGLEIDGCVRGGREVLDVSAERRQSHLLFFCRYPLDQPVFLRSDSDLLPVLQERGLPVQGARPWLLSGWIKAELGVRVTGVAETRGEDLGANFGARGLLLGHIGVGARADVLIDSKSGRGQFLAGPELGYVNTVWPCARCSVEASLSYLVGYAQGLANGPEADLRFGYRLVRTGQTWHGIEAGAGYRHLIGPEAGGSVVLTLSYTLQTSLRWSFLPPAVRAAPLELGARRIEKQNNQDAADF